MRFGETETGGERKERKDRDRRKREKEGGVRS
jgi:hypothetical protein